MAVVGKPESQTTAVFCLAREGLATAVQARLSTAGMHLAAVESELLVALDLVELVRPTVFVVDTRALCEANESTMRRLRDVGSTSRILLYSIPDSAQVVRYVIDFRIRGFLPRYCTPGQCLRAIRAVQAGELWLSRKLTACVVDELLARLDAEHAPEKAAQPLSHREAQIVRMLKEGLTDKEVGQALGISPSTVKTHVGHIFVKLGISRRTQL
jgi:DNA-binding NarL/FixJ family response regulator